VLPFKTGRTKHGNRHPTTSALGDEGDGLKKNFSGVRDRHTGVAKEVLEAHDREAESMSRKVLERLK